MALRMIRDLNWGSTHQSKTGLYFNDDSLLGQRKTRPFSSDDAIAELMALNKFYNDWEEKRWTARSKS
jgi:hypothetical protein